MKKLLGILGVLFVLFSVVHVSAKSLTFEEIVNQAEADSEKTVTTNLDGTNLTIEAASIVLNATYDSSTKEFVYIPGSNPGGETTVLDYIVKAITKLQGFSSVDIRGNMLENPTKYTYSKCGIEGSVESEDFNYTALRLNTDSFNPNCTNSESSSSGSKQTTTTTTDANVKNPKTGVFVPVAGLSLLIVASVVCLVWISKKSFRL